MKLIPWSIDYIVSKLDTIQESKLSIWLKECRYVLSLCMSWEISENSPDAQQYLMKYGNLLWIWNAEFISPILKEWEVAIKDVVAQLKQKTIISKKILETTKIQLTWDLAIMKKTRNRIDRWYRKSFAG